MAHNVVGYKSFMMIPTHFTSGFWHEFSVYPHSSLYRFVCSDITLKRVGVKVWNTNCQDTVCNPGWTNYFIVTITELEKPYSQCEFEHVVLYIYEVNVCTCVDAYTHIYKHNTMSCSQIK